MHLLLVKGKESVARVNDGDLLLRRDLSVLDVGLEVLLILRVVVKIGDVGSVLDTQRTTASDEDGSRLRDLLRLTLWKEKSQEKKEKKRWKKR